LGTAFSESLEDGFDRVVSYSELCEILKNKCKDVHVIDARSVDDYEGKAVDSLDKCKPGRIPYAINIPPTDYLDMQAGGAFKSVDEIREVLESYKLDSKKEIVVYCKAGMQA
jgi:3-mercaptopyruvate sulfurtransferase SseA